MINNTIWKYVFTCFILLFANSLFSQQYLEFLSDENLSYKEKVELAEEHFDIKGRGKHTGYKQFLRWKYFAERKLNANGYVITEQESIAEYDKFVAKNSSGSQKSSGTWMEKGPLSAQNTATWSSHIGRLSNIAIDPNDDTHMIVTSLGGGVWKTTDEGANWIPLFDFENTMDLQSALISHTNADHYFVGTTGGIRRSINGGTTWTSISGVSGTIYSIIMDPTDANKIYASSSNGRVYRSADGGNTWNNTSVQTNINFYDLDFKPGDASILYTSGRSGAMYESTDSGVSWSAIVGPWNNTRTVMFAVTPHDPSYIYVLQESGGGFGGLYLSIDGGINWATQSTYDGTNNIMGYDLDATGGQAPRDMDIIVSPTDKTEVHVAGIMTAKSTNSGTSFDMTTHWVLSNPLPFVHADIDQLIYHGSKIYVASDGGIFISEDQAASFIDKTTGLGIRQFYRISASTTEVARVAGGSQDNGTGILHGGIWYDFMGADGMEPCVLNNDDDIVIGSIQFGALNKSNDGGATRTSISQTQNGENGEWVTPLERDPIVANTIYQGKRHLYKSTNAGGSWSTISDVTPFSASTRIDEICIAPTDNNVILISYTGELFKTIDGGETWDSITPPSTLSNNINYISIHPTNPDRIALATSGGTRFIESTDGGANWTDIIYNLPNTGSNSIVYDGRTEDGIYVSMSKGVYYKDASSPTTWTLMDTGLPKVNVTELEVVDDKLYAGTYGRGVWELTIPGKGWMLNANSSLIACISQGTPDSLDDAFTFQLAPNGMGLGATYSVTGDITETNIAYNTPFLFDNDGDGFLKQDGPISITITDDTNPNAVISVKIHGNLKENCFNNATCLNAFDIEETSTILCPGPSIGEGASTAGRSASWYKFTPPYDGTITVRSCGYEKDTNLKIHSGLCSSLTEIAAVDDNCTMGPGLNAYASELVDIQVNKNEPVYIEWDSRWSSDPFNFDFIFNPECTDILMANVTEMDLVTFQATSLIDLNGLATGNITAKTQTGIVEIDNLNVDPSAQITLIQEDCETNLFTDAMIIAGNNESIPDNGSIDIDFEFPASLTDNVVAFSFGLKMDHGDMSELKIELVSPDGNLYPLWNNFCPGQKNLNVILDVRGDYEALCSAEWQTGRTLYTDGILETADVDSIKTKPIAGNWKIRLTDSVAGNVGVIEQLHIYFKGN